MSAVFMVGVDCSDCSNRAIEYAVNVASTSNSKLVVTHVIEWSAFSFSTVEENSLRHKRREEELERAHQEIIDPLVSKLQSQGLDVTGMVRHGHVAETLNRVARENNVTNLIVGRLGSSSLKSLILGSVGSNLVQIADCPVTVVP